MESPEDTDVADFFSELIDDLDIDYTEPQDYIAPAQVENVPGNKKRRTIHYEYDVNNYIIPPDVTVEEMIRIIRRKPGRTTDPTPQDVREKISIANKGVKKSEEHRKNISKALKGKPKSEEHKQKIRDTLARKKKRKVN